ncbi:glycosyltransferase family 4 protein [SAR86 cluster bacterium]|nr:glycosyltransferase family 4 protein [SAR86 cluster bacterium]
MNIALFIDNKLDSGGAFQCSLSNILNLIKSSDKRYKFKIFTTIKENLHFFEDKNIEVIYIKYGFINKLLSYVRKANRFSKYIKFLTLNRPLKLDAVFAKYEIDLVYFVSSSPLAREIEAHNFVYTLWDLCHLDHPEFPEVSFYGEFESRQALFNEVLPKAINIIVESEMGKQNLIKKFNIDADRITILPVLPSDNNYSQKEFSTNINVDIKTKYLLKEDYIFYPAQFWAHKNHIYILEGIKILIDKGYKINAIFSGSDKGNLEYILKNIKKMNLEDSVKYIGFVDNNELSCLYKQALALVMPTYFGPTNLPPYEAFLNNCPVLYSDLPGLRDQVKDSALLMNLKDPESLANNLIKIINKEPELIKMMENSKFLIENLEQIYIKEQKKIFDNFSIKRKCWD